MTKLITIEYDEYLDLIECKKILEEAKIGNCLSSESGGPIVGIRTCQIIYNAAIFNYLQATDKVNWIEIRRR